MTPIFSKIPIAGRGASRWFLFLVFYHLLPVPWYLAVAAGLAPGSFLLAGGLAGLYSTDFDSLAFAVFLLGPALIAGGVFILLARLLSALIGKLRSPPLWRTLCHLLVLGSCLAAAMNPVFIPGGHGSTSSFSLFGFIEVLSQFQIPVAASVAYFSGLSLLLAGLLTGLRPGYAPAVPVPADLHRRARVD